VTVRKRNGESGFPSFKPLLLQKKPTEEPFIRIEKEAVEIQILTHES